MVLDIPQMRAVFGSEKYEYSLENEICDLIGFLWDSFCIDDVPEGIHSNIDHYQGIINYRFL